MKQIDPRVERNTSSLLSLEKLLRKIIQSPGDFKAMDVLLNGLKSQGGLAKLHLPEHGITTSSLNTIKRISDKSLDGGFNALDKLRLAALRAIENEQQLDRRSNKITRIGLSQRVTELEAENQTLQQDLLLLTQLLERSLRQARYYAEESKHARITALCRKEQAELHAYLSDSPATDVGKGE